MKLFIFPQYQQMMDHFRAVANGCATDKMRSPICRVEASQGAARLQDHTMNVLTLTGGATQIKLPEAIPGKVRQFCLRLTVTGDNVLAFTGASLESDVQGYLLPPADGETVLYTFTETFGGVLFVQRRKIIKD